MPLSEREQQILAEIEKSLHAEDPGPAPPDRRPPSRLSELRRVKAAAFLFVLGIFTLIAFFVSQVVIVGVLAFGAMVGGIVLGASSLKGALGIGGDQEGSRFTRAFAEWEERLRKRYKKS